VLVGGEAGIGKTTLLHDVSRLAVKRGMVVINASATALDRSRPFGPLVDVLGDHLLPASTSLGDQRRSPLQTSADDRIRMIDSITDVLEQWSVDKPVLLAVDDLQWSDPALGLSRPIPGDDRPEIDATARRCMALVDGDVSLIDEAVEVHQRCLRPVEVALALEAAAFILARRGHRAEAQRSLDRCLAMCGELQLAAVVERLTRGLADLGVDVKRPPANRRPLSGWASLTGTEKRIARLVGLGGNNRDVAEALFISRRTVESHRYRIFAKLDITNRTALAAIVLRETSD
jgi:DNA-binding CsgD family transcriptional regulator